MMELLSPAGSRECLTAAVQNGADAVYFGGSILNARRFANNFAGDALIEALDYCHERGVRAYITLNTLVFDREIPAALDFAEQLWRYGADAVLVQDLGLAALIRHYFPELVLHASTQMGIHDPGGLRYCEEIGLKRAVLAREVSLARIAELKKNSSIELEAFGHGALCMSFSGSCLYSSMAGERSGNRGTCAQPCRKAASVSGMPGSEDFCLSPNDICMIEHLKVLEKAGVCCIKIEGRMKKSEYVAAVTRCYRAALDGASADEIVRLKAEMFRFFNRGEFSTSHMFRDSVRTDRVGSSKPEAEDVNSALSSMQGENRRRPVSMELTVKLGEPAELTAACCGHTVHVTGETAEKAAKPQCAAAYAARLQKLGDTPFTLEKCEVHMDEDCFLSAAAVNALRRSAADALLKSFRVRRSDNRKAEPFDKRKADKITAAPFTYTVVSTADEARTAFENGADMVGIEPAFLTVQEAESLRPFRGAGKKLILVLPNVLITASRLDYVSKLISSGLFDGAEANNIGQTYLIAPLEIKIAGIGLNAFNTFTVNELLRLGFTYVVPSVELTAAQLRPLFSEFGSRLILFAHGRVPLMQLLHCPVKEHLGCRNCRIDAGAVTDEAGRRFPLVNQRFQDGCLVRMLNCSTTDLLDLYGELPEAAGLRLTFVGEAPSAVRERLGALDEVRRGGKISQYPSSTRGHMNRKVE